MYRAQYDLDKPIPLNTGILLMDVSCWKLLWPEVHNFTSGLETFPRQDQELLNMYFYQNWSTIRNLAHLPNVWNWTIYWSLEEHKPNVASIVSVGSSTATWNSSFWDNVKIVCAHGPKMNNDKIRAIAFCQHFAFTTKPLYQVMYHYLVCSNSGHTAN
jgi:hypothetical protein